MKNLIAALLILALFAFVAPRVAAQTITTLACANTTQTCVMTVYPTVKGTAKIAFYWSSDASGNCVCNLGATIVGRINRLTTCPLNSPTDNYDITLKDELGADALSGNGANRDTANPESVILSNDIVIYDQPTLSIANAGNAKTGIFVFYMKIE